MEQKLPKATAAITLSIISFIGCCCSNGFGGLILAGIALYLVKQDTDLYNESPEEYSNFGTVKTAKIISIISIVLSLILVGTYIYMKVTGKDAEMQQRIMEWAEEMQQQ
ncbi:MULTISPECIES: CCC motif membrane protein [Cellulophaga]|uniref:CCC motif membrane protein n=1 Tax=Cellulophaga TaxID=104264 RepID=UPI0020905237|nr:MULTISPECIES: CCC motif membrane protein [Cellulophaga]MDO6767998.1 CCC motif membrane protein [Cellulophaga sp. 1_MG-2023]